MADNDDVTPVVASPSSAAAKGIILVVRHAFADYQIGEEITEKSTIKEILDGELAVYVIKRAA